MSTNELERQTQLPVGFNWVRLGDHVSRIGSGFTPRGGQQAYVPTGIPLIRSQNVHMNRFKATGLAFISPAQDAEMAGSRVQENDVLLNITGASIGRVCVADREYCPANVNQHVCVIRTAKSIDPEFLAFFLSSPTFQAFIWGSQAGATRQALTKGMVEDFLVPSGPLIEQRRIAARLKEELAEVARARAAVEAQLKAAQLLPAALLRDVFESSEARSWPRRNLADICAIDAVQVDPTLPEYRVLPHVNGENIESGSQRLTNIQTAEQDGMTSGKYLFESGNVLYSKLRPYLRKVAVARFRGLCSADMYPIRVFPESLDAEFTAWLLLSDEFTTFAVGESQRSRMPKLNREQLFSWNAPIPDLSRQRSLAHQIGCEMTAIAELNGTLSDRLSAISCLPGSILNDAFNFGMEQNS